MLMKKIAVVEDQQDEQDTLRAHFSRYSSEKGIEFHLTFFAGGEEFLSKYRPVYDMVLLDIGLPGLNGMEVAARVRDMDQSVMLIFVTNMAQFAVRGYEVDAFDFLVKPVGYANFAMKLQRALNRLNTHRQTEIVINTPDGLIRLPSSQIKYIEISGHKIVYQTTHGPLNAYGNLKEIEKGLDSKIFIRCNSCYLVNLNFVSAVRGFTAVVGGDELQISRPKRKAFIQALNDFLGGGIE